MAFGGEYKMSLDDKSRIRLPMPFRTVFDKEPYVIHAGNDGCLFVVSQKAFDEKYGEIMDDAKLSDKAKRDAFRKLSSTLQFPEEDSQGRFVLQPKLKAMANIKKKVVFLGAYDHIEIWNEEAYDERFNPSEIDIDAVLEALES